MGQDQPIKLPFTKFPVSDFTGKVISDAFRPMLAVILLGDKNIKIPLLSLLDTGADDCCFPGQVATALGHNLAKGTPRKFQGVGGMVIAYLHQTDVSACGHKLRLNAYYSDDWNESGIALLGQNSFFTRFDVLFSRKDKEFTLWFKG